MTEVSDEEYEIARATAHDDRTVYTFGEHHLIAPVKRWFDHMDRLRLHRQNLADSATADLLARMVYDCCFHPGLPVNGQDPLPTFDDAKRENIAAFRWALEAAVNIHGCVVSYLREQRDDARAQVEAASLPATGGVREAAETVRVSRCRHAGTYESSPFEFYPTAAVDALLAAIATDASPSGEAATYHQAWVEDWSAKIATPPAKEHRHDD
jgi:hypothetical protein